MEQTKTQEYNGVLYEIGKVYAFKEFKEDEDIVYGVLEQVVTGANYPFYCERDNYKLCFPIENVGTTIKLPDPIIKEAATVLMCDSGIDADKYLEYRRVLYEAGLLNKKEEE